MSGEWPPDWEDEDEDDVGAEAGQADAETSARLSEVTAYLANRVVLEALSGMAWQRRKGAGEQIRRPGEPLLEHRRPLP